jgi:hypothetical protein
MSEQEAVLALLNRLLVGADQLVLSVDEWAARLDADHPTPLVSRFLDELAAEWYPAAPPDGVCAQVLEQARARVSAWHPGWPHSWGHTLRVTGLALALAQAEGVEPALAYVTSICHDVAKLDEFRTGEPHEQAGAAFAARVLHGHLAPAQIDSIQAAILKRGDDRLCSIVYDADHLDKIGAAGIVRRVSSSTQQTSLSTALWRVMDDAWLFPKMHFERSDALFRRKRAFQAWFLPMAEQAVGEW